MRLAGGLTLATMMLAGGVALTYVQRAQSDPSRDDPLKAIGWLAGCFEMRSGNQVIEEIRMAPKAGSMLGMGRTTTAQGLVEYELTLIADRHGGVVYEAHPSGQPAAVFKAKLVSADSAVFAEPAHDYPQIVGYAKTGRDSVVAWIDGTVNGKRKAVVFSYRRVSCPR
jgi:hypothetical protein